MEEVIKMAELLPINTGRQQCSFTKLNITIPAGGSYKYDSPFNYFRCYDATFDFEIAWSTNSSRTDFGAGFGVKFDDVIPYVIIFNSSVTPLTISIGVGIGYFDDSRLSVSGNITTIPAQYTAFSSQEITITNGLAEIPAARKNIIQNTGSNIVYIGSADGLQLKPLGTFEYSLDEPLTVYGTNGDTISVGSFN